MSDTKVHETGAQRSRDADDYAYSLIPTEGMDRLARTLREGAIKYGDDNWRKGFKWRDTANHLLIHLFKWLKGDTTEDHLGHAAANLFFLMEFEKTHIELDDRYKGKNLLTEEQVAAILADPRNDA